MINTDPRSPTEVLMDALASVEKCTKVTIIMEGETNLSVKTNCSYRDLSWMLDQAKFCMMTDVFDMPESDK